MSTEHQRHSLSGATMGTRWSVAFYAPTEGFDLRGLGARLQGAVDRVCAEMSPWEDASTANQINALGLGDSLILPDWTAQVLQTGLSISQASAGFFELGVLSAVDEWGFGRAEGEPSPSPRPMPRASAALDFDPATNRLTKTTHTALDFCGIAKGFGVDKLADVLRADGIKAFLVSIDGEVLAGDPPPGADAWSVALERPDYLARTLYQTLNLSGCAAATSGNYRHFRDHAGLRYAHTIDASTGWPSESEISSVTVLAETCMEADAWATALLAMGDEDGVAFAEDKGLAAFFLLLDDGELLEYRTEAFPT